MQRYFWDGRASVLGSDFTPSWFTTGNGQTGIMITQVDATTFDVTFDGDTSADDTWTLNPQPSYVIPGQTGTFS